MLYFLLSLALLLTTSCTGSEPMDKVAERVFERAQVQLTALYNSTPEDKMPVTFENGKNKFGKFNGWTSGFFPGSLWYIYEYTNDPEFREMAEKQTEKLDGIIGLKTHHDIGFQVNSSFGNGYRLTGNEAYKDMVIAGADKLCTRFNPTVGCTRSWEPGKKWQYPVIIDNMMNLEILANAYHLTGDKKYMEIATSHANTTLKNHFREDGSCFHVLSYDEATGEVIKKQTHQGFCDASAWSRGQAWALYGFTMMYRETKDPAYLEQAIKVAAFIIPMLPKDGVPEWDFNAPGTKHAFDMTAEGAPKPKDFHWEKGDPVYRDSSAGAIMASAFVELSGYTTGKESAKYRKTAEKILRTLASPEYMAEEGENGNFLLKHGVTNLHRWDGVDIPLTYGDYYFLEALLKFCK